MTPGRCSTSTGCTSPRTRRSTWPRSARTSSPARRTSSSARTAACWPAGSPLLEQLRPDKLLPSTDVVPERFELGTLPYELLAGTTAAVDFLAALGAATRMADRRARLLAAMTLVEEHEDRLRRRIEAGLADAARRDGAFPGRAFAPRPCCSPSTAGTPSTPTSSSPSWTSTRRPGRSTRSRRPGSWAWATRGGLRVGLAPYSRAGRCRPAAGRAGRVPALTTPIGGAP